MLSERQKQVKLRASQIEGRFYSAMISGLRHFLISACALSCCGAAAAQGGTVQFFLFGPATEEQPKVLMWEQMNAQQRAQLWPLLTREQRLVKWRQMTQDERRIMRKNMTPVERRDLKQRFVIDRLSPDEAKNLKARKMTPAERELLRRQVIEVHLEMRGGVPFNCKDPTDCRRARTSSRLDEAASQRSHAPSVVTHPVPTVTLPQGNDLHAVPAAAGAN